MDLTHIDERIADVADVVVVDPRVLRHVIRRHRDASGTVPHDRCYPIRREDVAAMVSQDELELPGESSREWVVLVANPSARSVFLGQATATSPEINLRFYVREGERRGVAFIRELVPKRLIAGLARILYNEPYEATPMSSAVEPRADSLSVEHRLRGGGHDHYLTVCTQANSTLPAEDTEAHFFKEHTWGYGVVIPTARSADLGLGAPKDMLKPVRAHAEAEIGAAGRRIPRAKLGGR